MRTLNLTVVEADGNRSDLEFPVARILDAGFTGKNREGAMKHVEELKAHGVAAPDRIPAYFAVTREMVTTDDEIEVLGDDTSGEVEVVFLFKGDEVYIAVGSDHTDRELEKDSIPKSKVICAKVVSREVWRLADVKPHWERLKLQSWIDVDGRRTLYQEGSLADFLTVDDFLDGVRAVVKDGALDGMVLYMGTMPSLGGELLFSPTFEGRLSDDVLGRELSFRYSIRPIDWLS
ncbi:MAG: DUF2848 family protein [Deltaproteobacteria bacterium]|nr:DUF2848 family protein [Deltaproteobacteria bacterium]